MMRWKVVTRPVDEPDEEAGETGTIFEYVIRCGNEEVAVSYDEQRAAQIVRDHNRAEAFEAMQEALNDIEQESSRRKYGIPNARLRRRVSDIAKTALALVGRTHNE